MAGRKPKTPPPDTGGSRRLVRRLAVIALTVAVVAGLVWGISWLGDVARRGIAARDRYTVRFADIVCEAPPGADRAGFLSEVRYVSKFPATFQSLDPELQPKLAAAFATHPWVAGVDVVTIDPHGKVAVKLRFRAPVLAVSTDGGTVRAVDSAGVLLPAEAAVGGLPELTSPVPSPTTDAGRVWPNADVKRALELLEAHHPKALQKTAAGWRMTTADGKTLAVER